MGNVGAESKFWLLGSHRGAIRSDPAFQTLCLVFLVEVRHRKSENCCGCKELSLKEMLLFLLFHALQNVQPSPAQPSPVLPTRSSEGKALP